MLDIHHEDCGEATAFHYSVPNLRVTIRPGEERNVGATAAICADPAPCRGSTPPKPAMNEVAAMAQNWPRQAAYSERAEDRRGAGHSSFRRVICSSASSLARKSSAGRSALRKVGSMKRDGLTLGWGMAGCAWIAARFPAEASVHFATTAPPASRAARKTSAPAPTRSWRSSRRKKPECRSTRSKRASGDTDPTAGPLSGGSMATGSVVPCGLRGGRRREIVVAKASRPCTPRFAVRETVSR